MRSLALWTLLAACHEAPPPAAPVVPDIDVTGKPVVAEGPPMTFAAGSHELGCVAWSAATRSAACIVGMRGTSGTSMSLIGFGGAAMTLALDEPLDEEGARRANRRFLAGGYSPLPAATPVAAGTPLTVGPDVTLTLATRREEATEHATLTLRCGGEEHVLAERADEGYATTVSAVRLPTHAVVEIRATLARDGESGQILSARLVELATCSVRRAD